MVQFGDHYSGIFCSVTNRNLNSDKQTNKQLRELMMVERFIHHLWYRTP